MIVFIDNYDSFVFNIARYFREIGENTQIIRNDAISVRNLAQLRPSAIIISPGPCTPSEAGISIDVIKELSGYVPILGICLGHQCIGSVFGGRVVNAQRPMHGRASHIKHNGKALFHQLPYPLQVGRYHSLIVELNELTLSPLVVTARSEEGEIMAIAHRHHKTYGVQFHPESILTEMGSTIFMNFLESIKRNGSGANGATPIDSAGG